MRRFWMTILLSFACLLCLTANAGAAADRKTDVRVSVRLVPPFVEQKNGELTGFSIELWNAIAKRAHFRSSFVLASNVDGQLSAVSQGSADVGVGAISITAQRDQILDFSQPFLDAGLQIMARTAARSPESNALDSLLHLLFSPAILVWLGIALLLTIIPAHIVWFTERGTPEGMIPSKRYFPRIFQAFFWGLGALPTQADSMPRHWLSRIVAVLWMFTSVVFVAFYTAQLTASLTVQKFKAEINGPEDLAGKTVGVIIGSTAVKVTDAFGARMVQFESIDQAIGALSEKRIDAIVYDAPVLQYIAAHQNGGGIATVGPVFHREYYGFAFKNGSALRRSVDAALLAMREDGEYGDLSAKWFGK